MLEKLLSDFANWLAAQENSIALHESFYMFNWVESTHVLFLMLSLGMLAVVDLRMLGLWLTDVPASKVADRLAKPMFFGFAIMVITGVTLFYAIPVRYTHSIWFRIKLILLVAAAINAFLFHRHMNRSVSTWDTDKVPPKRTRMAGAISLSLWIGIVTCGRFIAYDWFDCGKTTNAFMVWATGCSVQ